MDVAKYSRSVSLLCPTCGGTQFETEKGADGVVELTKCAVCKRVITKDDLIQENSENISEHVKEMGKQITEDLAKELKATLAKAFRGNKNIRIK